MGGWLINGTQNFVASYEKVNFRYEDLPVLQYISFSVKPGDTIAILGATGSGKSTLTSLISRFYDCDSGNIYINDEPIENYTTQTIRSNVSVAMQNIFLFSETIEGNIKYGVPEANQKRNTFAED